MYYMKKKYHFCKCNNFSSSNLYGIFNFTFFCICNLVLISAQNKKSFRIAHSRSEQTILLLLLFIWTWIDCFSVTNVIECNFLQCIKLKFKSKQYSLTHNENNNDSIKKWEKMPYIDNWCITNHDHHIHIHTVVVHYLRYDLVCLSVWKIVYIIKTVNNGNVKISNGFCVVIITFKRMFRLLSIPS